MQNHSYLYGIHIKNTNPALSNKQFALQELRKAGFSFPLTVNLDLRPQIQQAGQLPLIISADIRISKTYFTEADFPEIDDRHNENVWFVKYENPNQLQIGTAQQGTDKLLGELVPIIQKYQQYLRPVEMLGCIEVLKMWITKQMEGKQP